MDLGIRCRIIQNKQVYKDYKSKAHIKKEKYKKNEWQWKVNPEQNVGAIVFILIHTFTYGRFCVGTF